MNKPSKIKKVIASVVCFCLISEQTLLAKTLFDDIFGDDYISNITPGGIYSTEGEYGAYIPGGVFFKFGGAFEIPEPIFSITSPSVSVGCGGLSIKGMFVSIINLERLGAMLKNAGASLAWGVAVGLFYSLPGVGKAFDFINDWAKKNTTTIG